jgi:hypothetical protein
MTKKNEKVGIKLSVEEANVCATLMGEGFTPTQRRKYPVDVPLTDSQLAEFGDQVSAIDGELKVLRQGKNATSAALNREKKEKEGEMHSLAARIITKKDLTGRPLTVADRADLARQQARARKDFDEWETQRKATIKALADELKAKEKGHADLSKTILEGKGKGFATVIDLTDFASSTVVTVRADTGVETARRALDEFERQQLLLVDINAAEAMTDTELGKCYSGKKNEAVASYAKRNNMSEAKASAIVSALCGQGDEELPPEDGDDEGEE